MASLNKLAIRGIRSFDDKNISVIEFFSPVTVIVGHNGSGKTTIIECLKYATTGDQPPNTRGGAFIHDPKMANEKEVKAQVKLRFHSASGSRMLAIRNLSVTVKKTGTMTMKTLEGVLGFADGSDKTGKRGVISTKCAEMDTEIPQLLGVSKAVLENVIFCHQEDSYWPLAEPATLKKKFDDIFEATRYTKALDAIRALRKDKVADQKAERERLEGLSREKEQADRARKRVLDTTADIAAKTITHDKLTQKLRLQTEANKKFYESSTKFREIFMQVDSLESTKKHYQDDLDSLRENLTELAGSTEDLESRLRNFSDHISKRKEEKRSQEITISDLEDTLKQKRGTHRVKVNEHGQLTAEAQAHEKHVEGREKLIRELNLKHNMQALDNTPLDRTKVAEFISRLSELQSRQNADTERIISEDVRANEEYNKQYRTLHSEREGNRRQQRELHEKSNTIRTQTTVLEREVDSSQSLASEVQITEADIEEKKRRIENITNEIQTARFDQRISEKSDQARTLESRQATLFNELRRLHGQAECRAKLGVKQEDLRTKEADLKNMLAVNSPKYRKLVGVDMNPDTMDHELNKAIRDNVTQMENLSEAVTRENGNVEAIKALLSNLKSQVKEKSAEVEALDAKIKAGMRDVSANIDSDEPAGGVVEAKEELTNAQKELGTKKGSSGILNEFRDEGRKHKRCPLCERDMNAQVSSTFDKAIEKKLEESSEESIQQLQTEVSVWEQYLALLQDLAQKAITREKLSQEVIPALKADIAAQETKLLRATQAADEAKTNQGLAETTRSGLLDLKTGISSASRIQQDIYRLKREIADLETDLGSAGTGRTQDDVQAESDNLRNELGVVNRELASLNTEKDRKNTALRAHEKSLSELKDRLSDLNRQLAERLSKEAQIDKMKEEVATAGETLKGLNVKISEANTAIDTLEQEYKIADRDRKSQISQAQRSSQELNMHVDKLNSANRIIEKYVKDKRARALQDCTAKIEELDAEIAELVQQVDSARKVLSGIEKEINEGNATAANFRDNIRARKLVKDIADTQAEIAKYDLEEAAKAKRLFEEQYEIELQKATDLQSQVAHTSGEITSMTAQLKLIESDLKEFKDINRRYRDQLIKVKLSDMANADLEKYAKALDSAIMKYHSLKMEEVNDTMRHLWNKTYQGTDIDGIKICSDDDKGTGARRSYNYRVVMTKDQVEMDMRGRCSAGQKMLASIIIRLALADSFGQNCGILALDEPTNALDTDNIDALASSLVDIINERKNHANFQLIIITHDENFLTKLGQSNVMEHYWRVSRDPRQKSIIERHRFG